MRFLVDANVPRSALALLQKFGHIAEYVRDIGLGASADAQVALHAQQTKAALLTRDLDFADLRTYPPSSYEGIVVLRLPDDAVAEQIVNVLERFLKQANLVKQLPGHLVILEPARVRFRPPVTPPAPVFD